MKNLIQYRFACNNAIFDFLKDKDIEALISAFEIVEDDYRMEYGSTNPDMGIWFRFGNDDTLANTINDIKTDINLPIEHTNYKFLIERFKLVIGLNPESELMIYFS